MKKILLAVAVLGLAGLTASQTFYDVRSGPEETVVNVSTRMDCGECPVSSWTLRLKIPEDAEVMEVESQNGEVIESTRDAGVLKIKTSTPAARSEKISTVYATDSGRQELKEDLETTYISLSGFPGRQTSGSVRAPDLLNARVGKGFRYSSAEEKINLSGRGPTNVVLAMGEGMETDHFEFFGEPTGRSRLAYGIASGTLGVQNRFGKFPVAKLDEGEYDSRINNWSAGQYTNASIVIRDSLEEQEAPILAHETVHGLNHQHLSVGSEESWFDEGTARYVEYLTRKALEANNSDLRTRNVFGEDTEYTDTENGKRYRYTLFSKGDREDLWSYYSGDRRWMKNWSPEKGRRDFGYAYSELIFRNYVSRNGSIRKLYEDLEESGSNRSMWERLKGRVDLTPCRYESRERFRSCLDRVNSYDHPVFISAGEKEARRTLEVSSPDVKNPDGSPELEFQRRAEEAGGLLKKLFGWIGKMVGNL